MKLILINLLILLLLGLSSCGPMEIEYLGDFEDANLDEVLSDNIKGIKSGFDKDIPISELNDDDENPTMDKWEAIEFYPLKSVSEDSFEYLYFNIYCEEDCAAYIHVTIEDLVIEYELVEEKVEDPETGEITIKYNKVEVSRETEVIDLAEGGEFVELSSGEGIAVIYEMNYIIKDYSSSTCFKLILKDENKNILDCKWGIDDVQIITSPITENDQ